MERIDYADSHVHIADCPDWAMPQDTVFCAPSHSLEEFQFVEAQAAAHPGRIVPAFGIHPQNPDLSLVPLLEELAAAARLGAVGEAGFDLFTCEFAADFLRQQEVWRFQLVVAETYRLPLVVHCRKAMDRIFLYSKDLFRLPAVVFHAFPGSPQEAESLLRRGVNGYFSFGKEVIRGRKNSIACIRELPADRILAETDAPYQTLRHQTATPPEDIRLVYREFAAILGVGEDELKIRLRKNFSAAFGLSWVSEG